MDVDQIIELIQQQEYNIADDACNLLLESGPETAIAYHLKGLIALRQAQYNDGKVLLKKAIRLDPTNVNQYCDLGVLELKLENYKEAEIVFQQALKIDPKHYVANYNLAVLHQLNGDLIGARKQLEPLTKSQPDNSQLQFNYGYLAQKTFEYTKAFAAYKLCLELNPNQAEAHNNIGLLFLEQATPELNNLHEARKYFEQCIIINANFPDPLLGLAQIDIQQRNLSSAKKNLQHALYIAPLNWSLRCKAIALISFIDQELCNWKYLDNNISDLQKAYTEFKSQNIPTFIDPFPLLSLPCDPNIAKEVAIEKSTHITNSIEVRPLWNSTSINTSKGIKGDCGTETHNEIVIKIGYISPDFRKHSVSLLLNDYLRYHDRNKFEIYAFALNKTKDEFTQKIIASSDYFIDLSNKDDFSAANLIAEHGIHILIDLAGYTKHARSRILAYQPAPIQCCHSLGYTFTMGADFIQYFITDKIMVPETLQNLFTEKVTYLPTTPFVTSAFPKVTKIASRQEFNLPKDKFVFCCFTMPYRIDENVFSAWMTILNKTKNSVLWLYAHNIELQKKLEYSATQYEVDPDRLIFLTDQSLTERWPLQYANLWLDTMSISNVSGILLGLWANLPVLAFQGNSPPARCAASICNEIPQASFVATSTEEYISQAIWYYNNPDILTNMRETLCQQKDNINLFNPSASIKHLETLYIEMWHKFERG